MPAPTRAGVLFVFVMTCSPSGCRGRPSGHPPLRFCIGPASERPPGSAGLRGPRVGKTRRGAGPADGAAGRGVLTCRTVNAFKPHLGAVADYPYTKSDARVKLDQNESPEDFPPDLKARALER